MEKKKTQKNIFVFIVFMLIMIGLGVSDSNRGVFAAVFERDLSLTKSQVSQIVTVSYIGNLLFMLLGGNAVDRLDKKKACMGVLGLWTAAQVIFALTDNYILLLIGMFVSMGASTLMNTLMNILSPYFFGAMAGLYINILFFVQGIGTSGNQKLTGTFASSYADYRILCACLAVLGAVSLVLLGITKFKKSENKNEEELKSEKHKFSFVLNKTAVAMGLVFGFYFVAEHGIMNWWSMYCSQGLGLDAGSASTGVALFFGTMTVGRLVMAPLVQKLGSRKSILILGGVGSAVYLLGVLLGANGVLIVGVSGIFLSIVYPTMVLLLQELLPKETITAGTGVVISIGTLFDIAFNAVFGSVLQNIGFGVCRIIFPAAVLLFYGGFVLASRKASN